MSEQLFVIGLGIGSDADEAWFLSGLGAEGLAAVPADVGPSTHTSLTRIQFTRGTNSIVVDAPAERRWSAPITGEAGEAVIRLPRDSAANSMTYINGNGGSQVRIISEGGCGVWLGTILDIDDSDPNELILTAFQPAKLLGHRQVEYAGTLTNVSAGYAAMTVLRGAGVGGSARGLTMTYGTSEGGVLSERSFDPNGDAWGGLTALMDASDGELHITATGDCRWIGPLAGGNRYDVLLVEGGNFQDVTYSTSAESRLSAVTSGDGPDRYTARRGDAAREGWPAQITIDGSAQAAQRELEARSQAAVTISGGVTSDHWSIRERDYVSVLVPRAGGTGRIHRCRVLARSLADGDHLMRLELQVIRPVVATEVSGGAGARQRPAQRASADGSSGSFAQVWRLLLRTLERDVGRPNRFG